MGKKQLKQFGDLVVDDFQAHPVWVGCHTYDYDEPWYDDTDEETFRPWDGSLPVDPEEGMYLVRTIVTLADGTEFPGFASPQVDDPSTGPPDLGLIQPQLFLPDGETIGFWQGMVPIPDIKVTLYAALDREPDSVFPMTFRADGQLASGICQGTIEGFYSFAEGDDVVIDR